MPVMLIADNERLEWTHVETESGLYYRRPTAHFQRSIQAKHTVKGITDNQAVIDEILVWAITGWFGIVDNKGAEVPFKVEHLKNLPELYLARFVTELYAFDPKAVELGN